MILNVCTTFCMSWRFVPNDDLLRPELTTAVHTDLKKGLNGMSTSPVSTLMLPIFHSRAFVLGLNVLDMLRNASEHTHVERPQRTGCPTAGSCPELLAARRKRRGRQAETS
jgi:hypothetical protein